MDNIVHILNNDTIKRFCCSPFAKEICPSMVGPDEKGVYYCTSPTHGYCDRRSGTCFCNAGYMGMSCEECTESHYKNDESLCIAKGMIKRKWKAVKINKTKKIKN